MKPKTELRKKGVICPACSRGLGEADYGANPEKCFVCAGKGVARMEVVDVLVRCPLCVDHPEEPCLCPLCGGKRRLRTYFQPRRKSFKKWYWCECGWA